MSSPIHSQFLPYSLGKVLNWRENPSTSPSHQLLLLEENGTVLKGTGYFHFDCIKIFSAGHELVEYCDNDVIMCQNNHVIDRLTSSSIIKHFLSKVRVFLILKYLSDIDLKTLVKFGVQSNLTKAPLKFAEVTDMKIVESAFS